jgi:hypothetical protein
MNPQELVDEIIEGEMYSEEEKEFARSVSSQMSARGVTERQLKALRNIINETKMYLDGYSPLDE